jgi:hypothetical protein
MWAPDLPLAKLQGLFAFLKGNANKLFKHSSQWCGRTLCENMDTVSWRTCLSPGRPTHYQASTYGRRGSIVLLVSNIFNLESLRRSCHWDKLRPAPKALPMRLVFTKRATKHWIWIKFYENFYEKLAGERWRQADVKVKDSRMYASKWSKYVKDSYKH